jgi:hypothetical protein
MAKLILPMCETEIKVGTNLYRYVQSENGFIEKYVVTMAINDRIKIFKNHIKKLKEVYKNYINYEKS